MSDLLVADDGITLALRRWHAVGERRGGVVLVHGFAATKDDPAVGDVADALAACGYDVLSYDGRGHGASGGTCTLGDRERLDVAAAVAAVPGPVVLVGASMGGIAVLRHAAESNELAGVITVSSPAQWRLPRTARALLAAGVTQTGAGRRLAGRFLKVRLAPRGVRAEPPDQVAARIRVPTAVIHGLADRFIPVRAATDLYRALTGPRRMSLVPGMGHAYDPAGIPAISFAVAWALGHLSAPEPAV